MSHTNDYKHTIFWALLTLVPFLFQTIGLIPTADHVTSLDNGITSILTGVILHGSWSHMLGNLLCMLLGVSLLVKFYPKAYPYVMFLGYFCPAIVMYATGLRSLGISGLAYTVIWFVIVSGLTSNLKEKFYAAIAVLFFYGSTLQMAIPTAAIKGIAWQSHLTGICVAMFLVIIFKLRKIY
tara:strand:- start:22525 stop:23067 length:543 start_codon:yes stop_codon:yes gene_type:complete